MLLIMLSVAFYRSKTQEKYSLSALYDLILINPTNEGCTRTRIAIQ